MRFPGRDLEALLGDALPSDHARQTLADQYIKRAIGRPSRGQWRVLDLGCGSGSSVDLFRARDPDVEWIGLDVLDSPEVRTRVRTDARFESFDGTSIPFADGSFDLVYCKQVLEHVRRPRALLVEVHRVLASGGWFAGSTSQLEPYHSMSVWNYTPFGIATMLQDAALGVIELRPGIDGLTLVARRLLGRGGWFDRWWERESPVNRMVERYGRALRVDVRALNAAKLVCCGQFAFLAQRNEDES